MSSHPIAYLTIEDYLEIEQRNEFRSEFVNGAIFAMAIPARDHDDSERSPVFLQARGCGLEFHERPIPKHPGRPNARYNCSYHREVIVCVSLFSLP